MPTTIKDIAARLGVSHSTVSRALQGHPYVKEDLRERVLATARQLNYRPNAMARGLKGMGSRVIGLLIPDLMNDFYASVATIVQATLAEHGYRVLLGVSANEPEAELSYLRAMLEERVEGLIWVPRTTHREVLREYADERVPVIEFARKTSAALDAVVADDLGGAQAATQHLLDLGHQRIGLIVGRTQLSTGRERREGFIEALRNAGLATTQSLIKEGGFTRAWGREATGELLSLEEPPTAVFATSSELVIGALQEMDSRGIRIPEQLSLVGYGDPDWFAIWKPPITTVALPADDMGTMAVHTVLRRIRERDSEGRARHVVSRLSCQLVVRGSVRPISSRRI
jgi:LacI family transcriptional regulator